MRTTISITESNLEKLEEASETLRVSKNEVISMLITRITRNKGFVPKLYARVKYQERDKKKKKVREHVRFEPVFYEKGQDLRRNFKFSVSWFVGYGIAEYLDEIVETITGSEKSQNRQDNYDRNFVYISNIYGKIRGFISFWGLPDKKILENLLI